MYKHTSEQRESRQALVLAVSAKKRVGKDNKTGKTDRSTTADNAHSFRQGYNRQHKSKSLGHDETFNTPDIHHQTFTPVLRELWECTFVCSRRT